MHPLLKRHILFYSNGLPDGSPDIRPIAVNIADCGPKPKVGQSSYTPKGTTRPPRGVVCKI